MPFIHTILYYLSVPIYLSILTHIKYCLEFNNWGQIIISYRESVNVVIHNSHHHNNLLSLCTYIGILYYKVHMSLHIKNYIGRRYLQNIQPIYGGDQVNFALQANFFYVYLFTFTKKQGNTKVFFLCFSFS